MQNSFFNIIKVTNDQLNMSLNKMMSLNKIINFLKNNRLSFVSFHFHDQFKKFISVNLNLD